MDSKESLLYSLLQRHAEGLEKQLDVDQDVSTVFSIIAFTLEENPKISFVTNAEPLTLSNALRELADIIDEQGYQAPPAPALN